MWALCNVHLYLLIFFALLGLSYHIDTTEQQQSRLTWGQKDPVPLPLAHGKADLSSARPFNRL